MRICGSRALMASVCVVALASASQAQAQTQVYNIPAGSLQSALDAFGRQSGKPIIYKDDEVRGLRSSGYKGEATIKVALTAVLAGTDFSFQRGDTGAIAIVKSANRAVPTAGASREPIAPATSVKTDGEETTKEEIVVTGTLIRGIAPGGSQTLTMSAEDIDTKGVSSTAELLATMPQSGFFGTKPAVIGQEQFNRSTNTPQLRNLDQTSATNPTLLLLDGHRLVGMGVLSNSPDIDAIPTGAIERVDVVPDGGSSIYGADAVGGVINLITRKDFDGAELQARYGFADDYQTVEIDATAGKVWDAGSFYVSYSFSDHDSLFGRDRDYVRRRDYINDVPLDLTCTPPNIQIGLDIYASPASGPGLGNRCDISDDQTFIPAETRHSALASVSFDAGDALSLNLKTTYSNRVNTSDVGLSFGQITLASDNPYYMPVAGVTGTPDQTVLFNFGEFVPGRQRSKLESWGFTPSAKLDIGNSWQVNALLNYGWAASEVKNQVINGFALAVSGGGAIGSTPFAGTFNPFDVGSPANAAALAWISDAFVYGRSVNELVNARIVADGTLFELPAGDLKMAVGAEYFDEKFELVMSPISGWSNAEIAAGVPARNSRNTKAVFGELSVPVIGGGPLNSLTLSLSGRYDDYSDFGGTFNPKIGAIFEPVDWVAIRGNWGKSFQAPGLADSAEVQAASVFDFLVVANFGLPFPNPAVTPLPGQQQLFLQGGGIDLKPQKAETWSLGIDVSPPFIPGLTLSTTYYNIDFKDRLGIPQITDAQFYSSYPEGQFYLQGTPSDPITEAEIVAFGALFGRVAANYVLTRKEQATSLSAPVSTVKFDRPRLRAAFTLGANIGDFLGQATLSHSGGFDVKPVPSALNQSSLDAFNFVDLFFKYDLQGSGLASDLSLTLNVNNVFDTDPPSYNGFFLSPWNGNQNGFGNGMTVGRLIRLGISKRF